MDKTQPHPLFKLATELGPLVVFFVCNAKAAEAAALAHALGAGRMTEERLRASDKAA